MRILVIQTIQKNPTSFHATETIRKLIMLLLKAYTMFIVVPRIYEFINRYIVFSIQGGKQSREGLVFV